MNKNIITERIAGWKLASFKGKDFYIVTTIGGASMWVPKNQFDSSAETISYKEMKAGEKYTKADKTEGELTKDRNEFTGCGRQIVEKYSSKELIEVMAAKSMNNAVMFAN